MFKRAHVSVALVSTLLLGAVLAGNANAQTTRRAAQGTYTNKKAGYGVRYPKGWIKQVGSGQDLEVTSPDSVAVFTAKASLGTATVTAIKAQQRSVLLGFGTPQGALSASVKVVNGVPYQYAEIVSKTKKGNTVDVLLLDTVTGGYLYDFEGFVLLKKPKSSAGAQQLVNTFNSIKIK